MDKFISEHLWFLGNAALVGALVATGSLLQSSQASQQPTNSTVANIDQPVEVSAPHPDVVAQPQQAQVAPVAPPAVAQPTVRPRIRGGEFEDDD